MSSFKHLFQRSLAAAPDRLHFAAHSHSLWPDASWIGHQAAWEDAARLADHKWGRVMGEIYPAAQAEVAAELRLPDPSTVVFAGNTHDLLLRIISARRDNPVRILSSDGEFHSFRRQSQRWLESGRVLLDIGDYRGRRREGLQELAGRLRASWGRVAPTIDRQDKSSSKQKCLCACASKFRFRILS